MWLVVDRYVSQRKSQKTYRSVIAAFNRFLGCRQDEQGARKWRRVTYVVAADFAAEQSAKLAGNTARRNLIVLRKIYRLLQDVGEIKVNPWAQVKLPTANAKRKRFHKRLSSNQVKRLLGAIDDSSLSGVRDRVVVLLMLGHGLRVSEVRNLLIEDFEAEGGTLRLRETKAGEDVELALVGWVKKEVAIWSQLRGNDGKWLFPSFRGKNMKPHAQFSVSGFNIRLRRYCDSVYFSSHSFRVTAITRVLEEGYTLEEARNFARHSTVAMTERYDGREFRTVKIRNIWNDDR